MKSNKKGFTLIELLAVIVILAIIALIATPIILNVIEEAKKNASKSSAYGYIEAAEKYIALQGAFDATGSNETGYTKVVPNGVKCTLASGNWSGNEEAADGTSTCKEFYEAVSATAKGEKPVAAELTYSNGVLTGTITMKSHSTKWSYDGTQLSVAS